MIKLHGVTMSPTARDRVSEVLASGWIGQGPLVDRFEAELASLWGVSAPVVTTNSGTSALELALRLCGARGRPVLSTPMTCTATNAAILNAGATIIWADVDSESGLMSPDSVRWIMENTRHEFAAIMAVSLGGRAAVTDDLRSAAMGIPIIEDAAHRLGPASLRGDYTCFSFQAIKFLTTGDGGAVIVPPDKEARARKLRWFGLERGIPGWEQFPADHGFKFHMNDISAAIGLENIPLAVAERDHRRVASDHYSTILGSMVSPYGNEFDAWNTTLLVDDPAGLAKFLEARNVEAGPVHGRNDVIPAYQSKSYTTRGLEAFSSRQINVPCGSWVTSDEIEYISDLVKEFTA